ncbi:YdeI family protein [Gangjinia marincola]|uniref:YdeI family protein n=1 Tax=Gangjinia marincola TaxID=578463 RepID=A0ABP3Y000_9FLAO
MTKQEKLNAFFKGDRPFLEGVLQLRSLLHQTELTETWKWNFPVYTLNEKNILGLGDFKRHFGLWFFNGVFLSDPENLLVNAQEGKTKALRQMRFTNADQINESVIMPYIREAIQLQIEGKVLPSKATSKNVVIPLELKEAFQQHPNLANAFNQLTPGKQREYSTYIREAKQQATKERRIQKITPLILALKGSTINTLHLNEKPTRFHLTFCPVY